MYTPYVDRCVDISLPHRVASVHLLPYSMYSSYMASWLLASAGFCSLAGGDCWPLVPSPPLGHHWALLNWGMGPAKDQRVRTYVYIHMWLGWASMCSHRCTYVRTALFGMCTTGVIIYLHRKMYIYGHPGLSQLQWHNASVGMLHGVCVGGGSVCVCVWEWVV